MVYNTHNVTMKKQTLPRRKTPARRSGKSAGEAAALSAELERAREELAGAKRYIAELEARADEDPLLPLLNRRAFTRELERALAFSRRYETPACLVYLDLDGFKTINDAYGHAAGDSVLGEVAEILLDNLRRSDVVGRLGGDEFGVLLWNSDHGATVHTAQRLARAIAAREFGVPGEAARISASYGLAFLTEEDTPEGAIERADEAMYVNKRAKRAAG